MRNFLFLILLGLIYEYPLFLFAWDGKIQKPELKPKLEFFQKQTENFNIL